MVNIVILSITFYKKYCKYCLFYYYDLILTAFNLPVSGGERGGNKNRNPEEALHPSYNSASTATPHSRLGSSGL
jgi:hypothetical protein